MNWCADQTPTQLAQAPLNGTDTKTALAERNCKLWHRAGLNEPRLKNEIKKEGYVWPTSETMLSVSADNILEKLSPEEILDNNVF